MSRIQAVLLALAALTASPALGASPDPKDLAVPAQDLSKARELIRRLGSEAYREREEAQAELIKMGRLARGPLAEAATADADPEVRQRAARLLPKANAADLQARLDAFLADATGKYEHDLPGLKALRAAVGEAEKARALYADILKSPYNLEMLAAADRGPADGGRAIADRRAVMMSELNNRNGFNNGRPFVPKQPTLPDIAALLLAETAVPSEHIPKTAVWAWVNGANFVQQTASMQALGGSSVPHAEVYKNLVAYWLGSRVDPAELSSLAYQLGPQGGVLRNFKEAQLLLRRILLTDGVQGYAKGYALNALLANGRAKDELPLLRAVMANRVRVGQYPGALPNKKDPDEVISLNNDQMVTQVWFNLPNGQNETHTCLMKDVALVHLIALNGGKIQDYGFEIQQGAVINKDTVGYGQYAFKSEVARNTGFMKFAWKQLKDGIDGPQPKDEPKPAPKPKDGPRSPAPPE